ncbi:MAG: hypothetical protein FJX77_08900 [Armatimonadetes bacterium]|nr:hypothetical protein [Armatimonadota bacterium]
MASEGVKKARPTAAGGPRPDKNAGRQAWLWRALLVLVVLEGLDLATSLLFTPPDTRLSVGFLGLGWLLVLGVAAAGVLRERPWGRWCAGLLCALQFLAIPALLSTATRVGQVVVQESAFTRGVGWLKVGAALLFFGSLWLASGPGRTRAATRA